MNPRRLSRTKVLSAVGLASGLLLALYVWSERTEQRQRLEIPREWARLAPYPSSAKDLRASTSGSGFSRAFQVSFSAPVPDIEQWLKASPGTRDVLPTRPSPEKRPYAISPGGGAQHAEVTVDETSGLVSIYVHWS